MYLKPTEIANNHVAANNTFGPKTF